MKKELSKASMMMYWIIVASAVAVLIWAYFMPVEISVSATGQIHYLGEPHAITAGPGGIVEARQAKSFTHVDEGAALIRILPDGGQAFDVASPGDGAVIWYRSLIRGDRVQADERLAALYPDDTYGLLIRLSDRDVRKIEPGMQVRISLDAYPFQEYGMVYGTVHDVTLELNASGWVDVDVLITLDSDTSAMTLRPGLTASADILVGRTTLLRQLLL